MIKGIKRVTAVMLCMLLLLGLAPTTAYAAKTSLSAKSVTVKVGSRKTIKLKGAKKAKWKVVSGKKCIKIKKYKKKVVVTGKKAGTAKIRAKVGKKKLYCTIKVTKKETNKEKDPVKVIEDGNEVSVGDFSVNILKQLRKESGAQNTLVSPDSIMSCLAMAANGAVGATKSGMEKGMSVSDTSALSSFLSTLHKRLGQGEKTKYSVCDSIWAMEDKVVLKDSFIKTNKEFLGSEVYTLPFDDAAVKSMNSWVNKKTDGMIPSIIDKLTEDNRVVLLNAVLFEGKWAEQYDDAQVSENETFTAKSGKKQQVSMLNGEEYGYISSDFATGFSKEYEEGKFAFVALLPKEGTTVDDCISKLDGETFIKLYKNRSNERVITKIPEFSYDYSAELKKSLVALGMGLAFTNDADFSEMADFSTMTDKGLHIERVIHKTRIELDRNGTRAAASTAAMMDRNGSAPVKDPKKVYLDRPFVYSIVDTATGMPLFLGTLDEVEAK